LSEFGFVNLVIDAGMVHHLKMIPWLLTNPCPREGPCFVGTP
jgi:hypothetical protein